MRTYLVSLSDHPLAMLRGIAELRGVTLASNARDEAAAQLAAALADEGSTTAAIGAAPPDAQLAWTALRRAGGRMKASTFARQFGEIRPAGPGRLEREALWRSPESAAEALWYRGLIFRSFADFGDGPMEYVYIPEDLPLPPLATPKPRSAALPAVPAPGRARHALNSLAVDACTVLAAVREAPLPLTEIAGPGGGVAWLRAGRVTPARSGPVGLAPDTCNRAWLAGSRPGTVGARQPAHWGLAAADALGANVAAVHIVA